MPRKKTKLNSILLLVLSFFFGYTMGFSFDFEWKGFAFVLLGILTVVLIRYRLTGLKSAMRTMKGLKEEMEPSQELRERSEQLATETRQNGITVLEDHEEPNRYFQEGIDLALRGTEPERVQQTLIEKMNAEMDASTEACALFRTIGETAPVFGFLGTLVGYSLALQDMNGEMLGTAIDTLLHTTVYGILIAYLAAFPIADLLEKQWYEKSENFQAVLKGISAIQRGSRVTESALKGQESE